MKNSCFIFKRKRDRLHNAVVQIIGRKAVADKLIRLLVKYFFHQGRDIVKVIVEGIAVDAAVLDDLLNGYFVDRFFIQQF